MVEFRVAEINLCSSTGSIGGVVVQVGMFYRLFFRFRCFAEIFLIDSFEHIVCHALARGHPSGSWLDYSMVRGLNRQSPAEYWPSFATYTVGLDYREA